MRFRCFRALKLMSWLGEVGSQNQFLTLRVPRTIKCEYRYSLIHNKSMDADCKPRLCTTEAAALVLRLYDLKVRGEPKQLVAYDDLNYFFQCDDGGDGYVLKVTNSHDSKRPLCYAAQARVMQRLSDAGLRVPLPIQDADGQRQSLQQLPSGGDLRFLVRVLSFVPGRTLGSLDSWTPRQLHQSGRLVGRVAAALADLPFQEALVRDDYEWTLANAPRIKRHLGAVEEAERRALAERVVDAFQADVLAQRGKLEEGVMHGDPNEQNILVGDNGDVVGVIDFGDCAYGPLVFDLAIAIMYLMFRFEGDPVEAGGHVLAGYLAERSLSEKELECLPVSVAARFAQSLVLGAAAFKQDPTNEYVLITTRGGGWEILERFWRESSQGVLRRWADVAKSYGTDLKTT